VRLPVYYGWVLVAVAFVTMGLGVNARTAFSLLFPPILDEFGWTRGATAGAFSVGFLLSSLGAPLMGRVMDRRGPRPVLLTGVVLVAGGLALAPGIRELWHFYATLGILVGGGSLCLGYTGHMLFLPRWFVRRRGLALGLAFSGVGVASIAILPWLQGLIDGAGWRAACWALAAVLAVVLLPLCWIFPRRGPEDLGLGPDGDPPGEASRAGAGAGPAADWTLARAARTARFWWVALAFFLALFAWYAVQVHQTRYLTEIGFAPAEAAWALGLVGLLGLAGQIALGHLSDRVGREWVWSLASLGFVVCYLLLLAMREEPTRTMLYAMVAAQGLLGYGIAALMGVVPAELFHGRHYGSIMGTLTLASVGGSAVGPWVAGAIHDGTGSYAAAFWMASGCAALSSVAIWLAAPRRVRRATAARPRPAPAAPAARPGDARDPA